MRIGPYLLLDTLGSGGHATVWLAEKVGSVPQLRVAIKLLHAEIVDAKIRARFMLEAEALRQLDTPDIVRILDSGMHEGTDYLVMEYVPRGSLAKWAGVRPVVHDSTGNAPTQRLADVAAAEVRPRASEDLDKITDWFVCSARGLAAAHVAGILHRDLKPGNILVRDDERACLADFGVALADGGQRLTTGASVVGTLAYMAPEQLRGEPASERSDLYSLCASFAEVFTGTTLSVPQSPIGNGDPARFWAPRLAKAQIPTLLSEILLRGLRRDPLERYPTVEYLVRDLEKWLAGTLEAPWRPNFTTRVALMLRRRRRAIVAAAAVVCLSGSTMWFGVNAGESGARKAQLEAGNLVARATLLASNPLIVPREARPLLERAARIDSSNLDAVRLLAESDLDLQEPFRAVGRLLAYQSAHGELDRADRWLLVRALRHANHTKFPDPEAMIAELERTAPKVLEGREAIAKARHLLAAGKPDAALKLLEVPVPASERPKVALLVACAKIVGHELEAGVGIYQSWLTGAASNDWITMLACARAAISSNDFATARIHIDAATKVPDVDPVDLAFVNAKLTAFAEPTSRSGLLMFQAAIGDCEASGKYVAAQYRLDYADALRFHSMWSEALLVLEAMTPRERQSRIWIRIHVGVLASCCHEFRATPQRIPQVLGFDRAELVRRARLDLEPLTDARAADEDLVIAARALLYLDRAAEALGVASRATKALANSAAQEVLGHSYARLGKQEEAAEAFRAALHGRGKDRGLLKAFVRSGGRLLAGNAGPAVTSKFLPELETGAVTLIDSDSAQLPELEDALAFAVAHPNPEYRARMVALAQARVGKYPKAVTMRCNLGNLLLGVGRARDAYDTIQPVVKEGERSHELMGVAFSAAHQTGHYEDLPVLDQEWRKLPDPPRSCRLTRAMAVRKALADPLCPETVKSQLRQ